jgi:cobalamin biosynthesis protein CobD/CbiB
MAGALDTQLEKQGCYTLGDDHGISPDYINRALRVMTVTAILFGLVVVLPVLAIRIFVAEF